MARPDIDVTAPYIERESLPIPEIQFIKSPEEAEKNVGYWIDKGFTSFKVYMNITRDDLKKVVAIAHKNNLKVTGHLCSITYREAAELGIDNLEHGVAVASDFVKEKEPDRCPPGNRSAEALLALPESSREMDEVIATLVKHRVAVTSTLAVF